MSLLEDKSSKEDRLAIERFEKKLAQLLATHADYQKKIIELKKENKRLQDLLDASTNNLAALPNEKNNSASLGKDLIDQINKSIKEIDFCLAYFEQA